MEGFAILVGLALIGWFLVGPFLLFGLSGRVRNLEERLKEAERRSPRRGEELPSTPETKETPVEERSLARAKKASREELEVVRPDSNATPAAPPPLPTAGGEETRMVAKAKETVEAPVRSEPPSRPPRDHPFEQWLEKVGLKPPHAGAEGANIMAWWSTRVGLVLGVIAAVFFGMYVNQNTVPWVRLAELVATAAAVFAGGWWMEKKLGAFGRALSAGGLALLYVSAYAAYGLPAMKVIDAPLLGALVQIVAVILMAAWALWRRNEGVFGLALGLGYITSWFTIHEGAEPLPLISLMVLVAGGATLFACRGWWSGLWAGLVGSGGGLLLLAVVKWLPEGGPGAVVGLGSAVAFTVILVVSLYWRMRQGDGAVNRLLPVVTSVGLLVGAVITALLKIDWEWHYASFAVLLLLIGFAWRGLEKGEGMREIMWAKASVLIALYLIAQFDGPVRAYALLAQAGTLLWLGRKRNWMVFEVGGLLAGLLGWYFLSKGWPSGSVPQWGRDEIEGLAYLLLSFGMIAFFSKGVKFCKERGMAALLLGLLVSLGILVVGVWRVDQDWALLVGLVGALVLWKVAHYAEMKFPEGPLLVGFLGSLAWLFTRGTLSYPVGWQTVVWIGTVWGVCLLLGATSRKGRREVSLALMLSSVAAVWLAGDNLIEGSWMPALLLAVALLWQLGEGRVRIADLRRLSAVPGVLGGLFILGNWNDVISHGALSGILLVVGAYWYHGWLLDRGEKHIGERRAYAVVRGFVLGAALLTSLQMRLEGAMLVLALVGVSVAAIGLWRVLDEEPLPWIGLAAMIFAGATLLDDERVRDGWHEVTVLAVFLGSLANGLMLARAQKSEVLGEAKVASLLWGAGAMASVLFGLVLTGEAAGWTTASWAVGAVVLLAAGFWGGLRGYRMVALFGLGCAIIRLFVVDVEDTLWRIVAFGITSGLLIGIGYVYNRYHKRLAEGDLDWGRDPSNNH